MRIGAVTYVAVVKYVPSPGASNAAQLIGAMRVLRANDRGNRHKRTMGAPGIEPGTSRV